MKPFHSFLIDLCRKTNPGRLDDKGNDSLASGVVGELLAVVLVLAQSPLCHLKESSDGEEEGYVQHVSICSQSGLKNKPANDWVMMVKATQLPT